MNNVKIVNLLNPAKLYRAIAGSIAWSKAIGYASQNEPKLASVQLQKIADNLENHDAEFHILRAYVALVLGKREQCIRDCGSAARLVDVSDKFGLEEKLYLKTYLKCVEAKLCPNIEKKSKVEFTISPEIIQHIKLGKIRPDLLQKYPLDNISQVS